MRTRGASKQSRNCDTAFPGVSVLCCLSIDSSSSGFTWITKCPIVLIERTRFLYPVVDADMPLLLLLSRTNWEHRLRLIQTRASEASEPRQCSPSKQKYELFNARSARRARQMSWASRQSFSAVFIFGVEHSQARSRDTRLLPGTALTTS